MAKLDILLILLLTSVLPSTAQQLTENNIIGRWLIYRHTVDSTLVFDSDNPQVTLTLALLKLKQADPAHTAEDSMEVAENVMAGYAQLKKIFIQFNKDGTYINTKIVRGGVITDDVEGGTYIFNKKEQTITLSEQSGKTLAHRTCNVTYYRSPQHFPVHVS